MTLTDDIRHHSAQLAAEVTEYDTTRTALHEAVANTAMHRMSLSLAEAQARLAAADTRTSDLREATVTLDATVQQARARLLGAQREEHACAADVDVAQEALKARRTILRAYTALAQREGQP